jgi:hypothetical protein
MFTNANKPVIHGGTFVAQTSNLHINARLAHFAFRKYGKPVLLMI